MSFNKCNDDLDIIAKLDDEPNDVGGLSAGQLKAEFDRAGKLIQEYINRTLLPQLEGPAAAESLGARLDGEVTSVQGALNVLRTASQKAGNLPTGGHAGQLLVKTSDAVYDAAWQDVFAAVEFAAEDWAAQGDGYVLSIPQSAHKRKNALFGCQLRQLVQGVYTDNTWAAMGTRSSFDAATGAITLTGADAFDGAALFC